MEREIADVSVFDEAAFVAATAEAQREVDERVDRFLQSFDEEYKRRLQDSDPK